MVTINAAYTACTAREVATSNLCHLDLRGGSGGRLEKTLLAWRLVVSQEGLCFMDLVSQSVSQSVSVMSTNHMKPGVGPTHVTSFLPNLSQTMDGRRLNIGL